MSATLRQNPPATNCAPLSEAELLDWIENASDEEIAANYPRAKALIEAAWPSSDAPEFLPWLETVTPYYSWRWDYLLLIQKALQRVTDGKSRRLMLFLPPRHGKSELTTIRYPVWRVEREPGLRVCVGCYNQGFAERFGRKSRAIAEKRGLVSKDRSAAKEWETVGGGVYRSCGVGSPPMGEGFDLIIIDDPVKSREEAGSPAYRDRAREWYGDLYTRQEPNASIIVIQTRWHEDDLSGRLLKEWREGGEEWEVVSLPANAETREERDALAERLGIPELGGTDPLGREPGTALCPQRFDLDELLKRKKALGSYEYSAQFQQRPLPAEGGLFQRQWFNVIERRPEAMRWVRFWDCAAKTTESADYTAGALVGRHADGRWCIADMRRGRWEYPDAKKVILQQAKVDGREVTIGIEDTSSGIALLQDLRRAPEAAGLTIKAVKVTTDKSVRAGPCASAAEGGLVTLCQELGRERWIGAFLDECDSFPMGSHDDQIDAMSGAWGLHSVPTAYTPQFGALTREV